MFKKILGLLFATMLLACSPKVNHLSEVYPTYYRVSDERRLKSDDGGTEALIKPYRAKLSAEMDQVIGQSSTAMYKAKPESPLGNWLCDATLSYAERHQNEELDFAVCNYGGIRLGSLPSGPITRGKIFELMPFDNYLVIVEASGAVVKKLFDTMSEKDGWPISGTVKYTITEGVPSDITIKGNPIEDDKMYKVVMSDYIAYGGDRCDYLKDQKISNTGVLFRDALIKEVQYQQEMQGGIIGKKDGRVQVIQTKESDKN